MTEVVNCAAALKELAKAYMNFKYFALDSDDTAYDPDTQSGPISEITTNGGQRAMAQTVTHDSETGVVTMVRTVVFTGPAVVKAICPMNSPTAGQGIALFRFIPTPGLLPDTFDNGGSLIISTSHYAV